MNRRTILVLVITFTIATLFVFTAHAWLAAQVRTTGDCGCSTACMGGKSCAINCPTGKAAHCDCVGGSQHTPAEAKCYCR